MDMMGTTTNRPITKTTLNIVKESFEEQKGIKILSLYEKDNDIYGVYINPLQESLSFLTIPLTNMSTDIDGHNIFLMELGVLLHLIYHNGSMQMYNWLINKSLINLPNKLFDDLIDKCVTNPPLELSSFQLIKWIEELNDGNLNMSTIDLIKMVQYFDKIDPLDIDVEVSDSEPYMKNQLNEVRQILKTRKYKKISEKIMNEIDYLFVKLQIDLYMTDDK